MRSSASNYVLMVIATHALTPSAHAADARAEPIAATTLPRVEVLATTPLSNQDITPDQLATALQTVTALDIERGQALSLGEYLNRRLMNVYINDVQNNPLQPDVNYRGYTASPLLGTPQGLAVYLDGVRLNQPFGDVVNWDLIPEDAIASISLLPGSNPLFGLNALGGALAIRTKDGVGDVGTALHAHYGSFARRAIGVEHGGHADNGVHWFVTGHEFREDGWRDDSASDTHRVFAKVGWRGAQTDVSLTSAYSESDLLGNGMQELRLLQRDYESIYTKPDHTENRATLFNLALAHTFSDSLSISSTLYRRDLNTRTLNGDINEEALSEDIYQPSPDEQAALTTAGYSGFPIGGESAANTPFPFWRCIANGLLNDEPNEACNGLINRTRTEQHVTGAAIQMTQQGKLAGRAHRLTVGGSIDSSRVAFRQSTQFAYLNPDHGVTGLSGPGAFADGTQASDEADDARVDISGRTRTWSLYASDTLALNDAWHLTASGVFYSAHVHTHDYLIPNGQPGSLYGDHSFSRFNPALGLTGKLTSRIGAYASVAQSARAPSAIELGCADPENPCRLPNSMAGDPPLEQVVATTVEFGIRAASDAPTHWQAGVFRTDNRDDILFVADDQSGFGYFTNIDKTRRQGVELSIRRQWGRIELGVNYTYLDATFQSNETVGGAGNSRNEDALEGNPGFEGAIEIEPGHRMPLIPKHLVKAFFDYALHERLSLRLDMIGVSSTYARGNENNEHAPDGVYYLGPGASPGYALFNMGIEYRPTAALTVSTQINNVFDKRYYTAAQLGATGFRDDGSFIAQPFTGPEIDDELPVVHSTFYSPGAPRSVWMGVKYRFDGK